MLRGEMIEIEARLDELRALGLHRRTRLVSGPQGPHVLLDGKPVMLLCSNNYLGFADHPRVRQAAADAAMRWGAGAGASRMTSGTMTVHRRLEDSLAEFTGRQAALLFGSGYLAGAGLIGTLARPGDVVFCDELSQAAIADGCRLSGAEVFAYDHRDVEHLRWGIEAAQGRGALIVTDAVFADTGDVAPLEGIVELAQRFALRTIVDEAHSVGALGPDGRGALAEVGLADEVDIVLGTLGAAFGGYGAFAACDRTMARYLANAARTFVFSTALPPPAVAGALAALTLLREKPRRVSRLAGNAEVLRAALRHEGFQVGVGRTHIVTISFPDGAAAAAVGEAALLRGVFAHPASPEGMPGVSSRLRLSVMATHREDELRNAAGTLATAARSVGIDPRRTTITPTVPHAAAWSDEDDAESPAGAGHGVFDFEAPGPVRRAA